MLSENINNLLDNLFYKEKLGIGNKTTFIKNVRDKNPNIKVKEILIHYYYNSNDIQPDLAANPPMNQVLLSSLSQYHGGQYKIYNFGSTPVTTTITSTLGGTIRQIAFWTTIQW